MKIVSPPCVAWTLATALALAGIAACNRNPSTTNPVTAAPTITPAPPPMVVPAPAEIYVEAPPPPPPMDVMESSPGPDFIWVGGYWSWTANRQVWVRGHWERPPRTHAVWVQPRWEHRGHGYVFVRGYWH